jgi:hypothetical protein
LVDGVSKAEARSMFNSAAWKVIKGAFKHARCICVATYYTHVLKQWMKPTQVKGIYLIKDQHLQRTVDWLVKNLKGWNWLCGWWACDQFRVMSQWNQLSKESVNHYGMGRHIRKTHRMVRKTHNFNSQLLHN